MKKIVFILPLYIAVFSCTHEEEKIIIKNAGAKKGNHTSNATTVIPNKLLSVQVEGMSCEMNCGGSIRKTLKKTGAVSRVEFKWVDEAEKQQTLISFDDSKISQEEIIQIIEKINEGQFQTSGSKLEIFQSESGK
jgi:copper chaperone CopZ